MVHNSLQGGETILFFTILWMDLILVQKKPGVLILMLLAIPARQSDSTEIAFEITDNFLLAISHNK